MSKFGERLDELAFERNLTNKMLAEKLNISPACVTQYMQGKFEPTYEHLIAVADFFQCSTDYLLGCEDEYKPITFKPCPPFSERLAFLKAKYKCSAYQIYTGHGISKSSYYGWINDKRKPSTENLLNLAKFFSCRIDYILGRED